MKTFSDMPGLKNLSPTNSFQELYGTDAFMAVKQGYSRKNKGSVNRAIKEQSQWSKVQHQDKYAAHLSNI